MRGSLQMMAAMLLSQHLSHHPGPAIHDILWRHNVVGIPESHVLRFDLMRYIY